MSHPYEDELLFIYHYEDQLDELEALDPAARELGLDIRRINLNEDESARKAAEVWTRGVKGAFPLLRIGDEEVRAMLFKPQEPLLRRLFGDPDNAPLLEISAPTMYIQPSDKGDNPIGSWFREKRKKIEVVDLTQIEAMPETIVQWAGRPVSPVVYIPAVGRFFDPPLEILQRLYG